MIENSAKTALQFARELPNIISTFDGGSLIEFTKPTRVEPRALIDNRAASLPYIDEVLYSVLNVFSAYYLQAVALTVNVGKVNVLRLLDTLNPERSVYSALIDRLEKNINGYQSMQYALPFIGKPVDLEAYKEYGYSQENAKLEKEAEDVLRRLDDFISDPNFANHPADAQARYRGFRAAVSSLQASEIFTIQKELQLRKTIQDLQSEIQTTRALNKQQKDEIVNNNQKIIDNLNDKIRETEKRYNTLVEENKDGSKTKQIEALKDEKAQLITDLKNAKDKADRERDATNQKHYDKVKDLEDKIKDFEKAFSATVSSKSIQEVNESANLSVGKLIEVTVDSQGKQASFPVQVRFMASRIDSSVLINSLTVTNRRTNTFTERYHKWKSGQRHFFSDLILCQDMIDNHIKNSIKDTSGYYKEREAKNKGNIVASILSETPSLATSSSVIVLTSETARQLELAMRGKLDRFKDREALMKDTYTMLLVVIDDKWQQVTIYHKSIDRPSELSVREIKRKGTKSGGGKDDTITSMLASLMQGKPAIV